jgi:hypothetical protein
MEAVDVSEMFISSYRTTVITHRKTVIIQDLKKILYTTKHYWHDQINNFGVLCIGETKNAYEISVRNSERKILFKYRGTDGKIILIWILMASLFWVVMQRMLVAAYRRFRKTYRSPLLASKTP